VAAEAQVRGALMGQHVPVIGAVDFVTGGAALDPGGLMFVKERAALVGVAADALLLLEPGQPSPGSGLMRVVAGRAGHDAFLEPVPLVGLELGENILVAGGAILVDAGPEQSGARVAVGTVAGGAVESGLGMRADGVPRVVLVVAGQALRRLVLGRVG